MFLSFKDSGCGGELPAVKRCYRSSCRGNCRADLTAAVAENQTSPVVSAPSLKSLSAFAESLVVKLCYEADLLRDLRLQLKTHLPIVLSIKQLIVLSFKISE